MRITLAAAALAALFTFTCEEPDEGPTPPNPIPMSDGGAGCGLICDDYTGGCFEVPCDDHPLPESDAGSGQPADAGAIPQSDSGTPEIPDDPYD